MDKIRNETMRTELETEYILEHIEMKQLRWWGHLQRMGDNIPVKQVWESKVLGKNNMEKYSHHRTDIDEKRNGLETS
ncbi:unnamed protein product [Acanthoscelides obtectus]|uniref:Uncharacterized protein n=1 Tax=Acanthoscelides obtectus TaxID=200917 RepID=A0A9P0JRD9_ACAOB|nr:unnamed protein product [Acanthoscelides obtectus]CAK1666998.1 hypothetical protein AOBTE_LOCUS25611 [Acanthoscelides obtectus]